MDMSTQCCKDDMNKTRWTINPDLVKYSFDYSFVRTNPQNSNFYQQNTPFVNRGFSPIPNPNVRAENLRRIWHAKEIASKINR